MTNLIDLAYAAIPGGIGAQEARGQAQFVESQTLPIDMKPSDKEYLISQGFIFLDPVDDLFVGTQFPEGWTRVATKHSMWSDLMDPKGRRRGSIFYKAAFYDRSASLSLTTRFQAKALYDDHDNTKRETVVSDCGTIIKSFGIWHTPYYEEGDLNAKLATDWLKLNYPEYKSAYAYWN